MKYFPLRQCHPCWIGVKQANEHNRPHSLITSAEFKEFKYETCHWKEKQTFVAAFFKFKSTFFFQLKDKSDAFTESSKQMLPPIDGWMGRDG